MAKISPKLQSFLGNNPTSKISVDEAGGRSIVKPWSDETLNIKIPTSPTKLYNALEKVYLPRRFSAIYHLDSNEFEAIYTSYKLMNESRELVGRKFNFSIEGKKLKCEFKTSSPSLLEIAKNINFLTSPSETYFRNITSFHIYTNKEKFEYIDSDIESPISFFISGLDGHDEESLASVCKHINFYISYYDNFSPLIAIFDLSAAAEGENGEPLRYISGDFPKEIASRKLDENLLSFWEGARKANEMLAFVIYYRIIEYCNYQYSDIKTRNLIANELNKPDLLSDIDSSVSKISGITHSYFSSNKYETERMKSMIVEYVDTDSVWKIISHYIDCFSCNFELDGGFVVKSIVDRNDSQEKFEKNGIQNVAAQARRIRNALSHGKDEGSDGLISPSEQNLNKLLPWVELMKVVAGQVVVRRPASHIAVE